MEEYEFGGFGGGLLIGQLEIPSCVAMQTSASMLS